MLRLLDRSRVRVEVRLRRRALGVRLVDLLEDEIELRLREVLLGLDRRERLDIGLPLLLARLDLLDQRLGLLLEALVNLVELRLRARLVGGDRRDLALKPRDVLRQRLVLALRLAELLLLLLDVRERLLEGGLRRLLLLAVLDVLALELSTEGRGGKRVGV